MDVEVYEVFCVGFFVEVDEVVGVEVFVVLEGEDVFVFKF